MSNLVGIKLLTPNVNVVTTLATCPTPRNDGNRAVCNLALEAHLRPCGTNRMHNCAGFLFHHGLTPAASESSWSFSTRF